MIGRINNHFARFRKDESGAVNTLEFAILMPVIFLAFIFGVELTTHSNRQFQLDRGLEVTTRAIRLNTQGNYSYEDVKAAICENAGGLDDCDENLRLEMMPMNPREFAGLPAVADCQDTALAIQPLRGWSLGQQHELMLMRACYRFKPVFSGLGLGQLLGADSDGLGKMISMSAFVQEPT